MDSRNGLAHDGVTSMLFGPQGFLWVATQGGLSRVNIGSGEILNFYAHNGLPSNHIATLAYDHTRQSLVVTTPRNPERQVLVPVSLFEALDRAPEPVVGVSQLKVDGDRHAVDSLRANPSNGSAEIVPDLVLTHRVRSLELDLAVFDYRDPRRNRYAYMLDGVDRDWQYSGGFQRRVSYTTLPAGSYRFLVRGADSFGRWTEAPQVIDLKVLPAPWLTSWAFATYAAAIVLLFTAAVTLRTRKAADHAKELEVLVAERTRELSEQRYTIEEQSARLRVAAESKDRLYTNVSHEFRTPLTIILGPVERLLSEESSAPKRRHLETIRRNARRLLRLIDQLMDLARLDAAQVAESPPCPAGSRLTILVESFRTFAEDSSVTLESVIDPDIWVYCESDAFEKIVVNLLSNAVKYNKQGGSVTVSLEKLDENRVQLRVEDTGIGMTEDVRARVFERFFRAPDTEERLPGSGLGMALVRELVAANGGEISLTSDAGVGTRIDVRMRASEPLPEGVIEETPAISLRTPDKEPTRPYSLPAPPPNSGQARVLVVEDSVDLCRYLEDVLSSRFACNFAHDGVAGLEAAVEIIPDIVICDVVLPSLNGLEVVRRLKEDERTSHIPVLMLSARAGENDRIAGYEVLADDYMPKPFSEAELLQRIESLISIRAILRDRFSRELLRTDADARPFDLLTAADRKFMVRMDTVLSEGFSDSTLSVSGLASRLAVSERQLQRKLKALVDQSPAEYLRHYRLARAHQLLRQGYRASEVSDAVGFTSHSYFGSCFKARFGVSPGQVQSGRPRDSESP